MVEFIKNMRQYQKAFLVAVIFVSAAQVVYGQYGPMGFGNATGSATYPQQPKLFLWLDGSDVTYDGSNVVTQWNDKSGNGQHFVPAPGANILYSANAGPDNTPCLVFDGAINSHLVNTSFQMPSTGYSIYFIFKSSDNQFGMLSYATSDANPSELLIHNESNIKQRHGSLERTSTQLSNIVNNNWSYGAIMWENDDELLWEHSPTGQTEPPNGGAPPDNWSNGVTIASNGTAVIGNIQTELNGGFDEESAFVGSIAEIIIWEGRLNQPQTRLMRTYLSYKYSFPYPSNNAGWNKLHGNNTSKFGDYFDIIGVGKDICCSNAGQHSESRSRGLVLNYFENNSLPNQMYVVAAPIGTVGNFVTTSDVPSGVTHRWNQIWRIGSDKSNSNLVRVGFDFSEGIEGLFPQNASGYRLLRRTSETSGSFQVVATGSYIVDDQIVFEVPHSTMSQHTWHYTLGTVNNATSSLTGNPTRTWYAYENGNWSLPTRWTLDGSTTPAYINPGNAVPGDGDRVIIRSGININMNLNNVSLESLQCDGQLDLISTTGHNFGNISGNGRIRLRGTGANGNDNFPNGNTDDFANPDIGGIVEFYGDYSYTLNKALVLNNVQVNLSSISHTLTLNRNLDVNGDLTIVRGVFQVSPISGGAARTINTYGNVEVLNNNGGIRTGTQNLKHTWNFYGDLVNNSNLASGQVWFTNRALPEQTSYYTTNENTGWVDCRFINNSRHQLVEANGPIRFSRIEINKGSNDTYRLTISANAANKFYLLGRRNFGSPNPDSNDNEVIWTGGSNQNALAIVNGTVELRRHIVIHQLFHPNGNYNINSSAQIWINGGSLSRYGGTAVVVYGKIRVSAGEFNARCNSGVTTRINGTLIVEENEEIGVPTNVEIRQFRTSVFGPDQIGGYIQTGGNVVITGVTNNGTIIPAPVVTDGTGYSATDNAISGDYAPFSLPSPGNVFSMSGGSLRIKGASSTNRGLIFINSNPEQVSLTGGTVIAEVSATNNAFFIATKVPFYNLRVERTVGTSPVRIRGNITIEGNTISDQPLRLLNNLVISSNAALSTQPGSGSQFNDVYIGRDLEIAGTGSYQHGNNTTHFVGSQSGSLRLSPETRTFNNIVVSKNATNQFMQIVNGNSLAMIVQGDFGLERGDFRNKALNVEFRGNVALRGVFGEIATNGIAQFKGASAQNIFSDGGVFHDVQIDNAVGVNLTNDDLIIRKNLTLTNGVFDIGNEKLRMEGSGATISGTPNSTRFIATSGNASAGGLEFYVGLTTPSRLFPIGVKDGAILKYTPSTTQINTPSDTEGYIRVVPVNEVLSTSNTTVGSNYLTYYWKVSYSGFSTTRPLVSHNFIYDDSDVEGDEDLMASARVLSDSPFDRSVDSLSSAIDHVLTASNTIHYNALTQGPVLTGPGFQLVNASYSAGDVARFTGRPRVFYSINSTLDATWNTPSHWSEFGDLPDGSNAVAYHQGPANSSSSFPQSGDIAVIGYNPSTGRPHSYLAPSGGIQASEIRFTPLGNSLGNPRYFAPGAANVTVLRPNVTLNATSDIVNVREISGEGSLLFRSNVDLSVTDAGDFLNQDGSIIIIRPETGASLPLNSLPPNIPNLFVVTPSSSGTVLLTLNTNVTVRGDVELIGLVNFILGITSGDMQVMGDFIMDSYQLASASSTLRFPNTGLGRIVEIEGNMFVGGSASSVFIPSPNTSNPPTISSLQVNGNIKQDVSGPQDVFVLSADATEPIYDRVDLILGGSGSNNFINTDGAIPKFGRIIVDKGINTTSSFSFEGEIDVRFPSDLPEKSIELRSGLVLFDHPDIDITLASGAQGDYFIPKEAGIHLRQGTLRLDGFSDRGLYLDGLLRIGDESGESGTFFIGTTEGTNNFLEYSASGFARLELKNGLLQVGSQLRRSLTNTEGNLKYFQSGGELIVGRYAAPNSNRGMFEIIESSTGVSIFEHTGGTITLVRGNNGSSASFLVTPSEANIDVGGGSIVQIGNQFSDGDIFGSFLQNIGIETKAPFESLIIRNDDDDVITTRLISHSIEVNSLLTINDGCVLDASGFNITINQDVVNDGSILANGGDFTMHHETVGEISGSGIFDLEDVFKTGGGNTSLTMVNSLNVKGNLNLGLGITNSETASIIVEGAVAIVDGSLFFDTAVEGLKMAGSSAQQIARSGNGTSQIDIFTIENLSGVTIPATGRVFEINKSLRLGGGVFNLNGNLLRLGGTTNIEEVVPFGNSNMINPVGAITQFGVEKTILANTQENYLLPIGLAKYTPVTFNFGFVNEFDPSDTYTSGDADLTLLISASEGFHPTVISPEDNALSMYWNLKANNVGNGFRTTIDFKYDEDYVNLTGFGEQDYQAIRVFNANEDPDPVSYQVQKLGVDLVEENANIVIFEFFNNPTSNSLSGEYFAGVDEAVLDAVPQYYTTRNGLVTEGGVAGVYDVVTEDGNAPRGAAVFVEPNHTLTFQVGDINFYSTHIDETAVVEILNSSRHRLGKVSGGGRIRIVSDGESATLPAGNYQEFFLTNCSNNATLEYAGSGDYNVMASISNIPIVEFSGTGSRSFANNDVFVCKDIIVNGPNVLNVNNRRITVGNDLILNAGTYNNGSGILEVEGDYIGNGGLFEAGTGGERIFEGDININSGNTFDMGSGGFNRILSNLTFNSGGVLLGGSGNSRAVFSGNQKQFIFGNLTGTNSVFNIEINNSDSLNLEGNLDVSGTFFFTAGNVNTRNDAKLKFTSVDAVASPSRGRPSSFVNGPMDWELPVMGILPKYFPVGKGARWRSFGLSNTSHARNWTVEYFDTVATTVSGVTLETLDPFVEAVSKQEYWKANSNSISQTTTARVYLTWGENSAVDILDIDPSAQDLVAMAWNVPAGSGYWTSFGGANHIGGIQSVAGTGGFGSDPNNLVPFTERLFTLGSGNVINSPLPVTWLYFEGETDGENHTLSWATATEINNDFFELERSIDGRVFAPIAQIAGAGNSTSPLHYSYVDKLAPTGRVYYRLRQVDFNGKFEFANEVVTLERNVAHADRLDFLIYPNPSNTGSVRLQVSDFEAEMVIISIADLSGKVLSRKAVWIDEQGISDYIPCNFQAGIYLVSVLAGQDMRSKPLVITK